GKIEVTILQSFIQGTRLRCWLSRSDCPPAIKECKALFDKHITGSREPAFSLPPPSIAADKQQSPVPHDLASLVSHKHATFHACYDQGGMLYSRHSTHTGNSLILFYAPGSRAAIPARIKYIFGTNGHVQFAVQRYLDADPGAADPFRHYSHFPARLYSKELQSNLKLVDPGKVLSHFAQWQFSADHIVVLALTKVG
ncbi:hypothetical protein PAXINDRAFT_86481, partial [Paxillus involutus ATCC 200175]